mgnify:CR=1 FL=1
MDQKKVGKRIQEYREKAGISQEELASAIQMSSTSVSNIERGRNFPSFETFIKICNAINVSTDLLLSDVVDAAHTAKASELSKRLEKLKPSDRQHIMTVVDSMIKSLEDSE